MRQQGLIAGCVPTSHKVQHHCTFQTYPKERNTHLNYKSAPHLENPPLPPRKGQHGSQIRRNRQTLRGFRMPRGSGGVVSMVAEKRLQAWRSDGAHGAGHENSHSSVAFCSAKSLTFSGLMEKPIGWQKGKVLTSKQNAPKSPPRGFLAPIQRKVDLKLKWMAIPEVNNGGMIMVV